MSEHKDESNTVRGEDPLRGEYVCYCNKVTEAQIREAMEAGAVSVEQVIRITGAMVNSNCRVNNPKGSCCYPDILRVFQKYKK